jgi:hypothetical protein
MTDAADSTRLRLLTAAFKMPSMQTIMSRKTSITNAFVAAVIPSVRPTTDEIAEALSILGTDPADVRCAYCGDKATEWDHLRPLVVNRRPTGFISEIANLVPSCGKCNQSKGNKPWREWMLGKARLSPTGRSIANTAERISRLEAYEQWRAPTHLDFDAIIESQQWERYWSLCDTVISDMRQCQEVANPFHAQIFEHIQRK